MILQETASQIPRYDWFTVATNVVSVLVTLAAVIGWYKRRQAKEKARFQKDLKPIMDKLGSAYGSVLSTTQIQSIVKTIVTQVSQIHFNDSEPPRIETGMEYPAGTKVNCNVCRDPNVIIEQHGNCPRCKLHSTLWWGERTVKE